MAFRVVDPTQIEGITRPHEPGEPARHVRGPSEPAGHHGDVDLLVDVPGAPPEEQTAELLDAAA